MTEKERRSNRVLADVMQFSNPTRFKLWQFDLAPGVWRFFLLLPLLLLAAGCGTLNAKYVEADRKKYESVAAEYLLYVEDDPDLDVEDKEIRRHNIKMWKIRIEEAERFLGLRQQKKDKPSIWDGWEPW